MSTCPRCQQSVRPTDLTCGICGEVLKAHGHPGMPLHRAVAGEFLCATCVYHADDSCSFPQRPQALSCTLYRNSQQAEVLNTADLKAQYRAQWGWAQRRYLWLGLALMVGLAVVLALGR